MPTTKFDPESAVQTDAEFPYVIVVNPGGRIEAVGLEQWDSGNGVEGLRYKDNFRKASPEEARKYHAYVESTRQDALAKLHGTELPADPIRDLPKLDLVDKDAVAAVPGWVGKEGVDPAVTPAKTEPEEADDDEPVTPAPTNEYRTKGNKPGPGK